MGGTYQSSTLTCRSLFHYFLFPHLCWSTPHAHSREIPKVSYSHWAGCLHYDAVHSGNKLVFCDWSYFHDVQRYYYTARGCLLSILGRTTYTCSFIANLPAH